MNSGKAQREKEHREATRLAGESKCLVCNTSPCEPCHLIHRGMGGGKAGWGRDEWVPLCRKHHDEFDARNGVSLRCQDSTRVTRYIVSVRVDSWRRG